MRKIMAKIISTEAQEQEAIFNWIEFAKKQTPELDLLFHVPNGGSRHPAEAAHLKRQGVKSGVPDLFLPVARRKYHGLFIELKRNDKNAKATANQIKWLRLLSNQGYMCVICHGAGEAIQAIQGYLNLCRLSK